MLDLHNEIVNNLILTESKRGVPRINNFEVQTKDYISKKVIARLLRKLEGYGTEIDIIKSYDNFHEEHQEIIGHYFGNIYQILKFIDESSIEDKKRYSSLYRAQFSLSEIQLLAYHCTSKVAVEKFKPLVEKYAFLEHLNNIETIRDFYDDSAFGEKVK